MSFFTYYGKLKDELFAAILPNGTVELDDPIHLFTQKQFRSYRARDVSVTEDGEDLITFHDGYYTFEVVTSKAYKSLNLTRKAIGSGETATVALTRHYDQPQTGTTSTDRPKIWTGVISFHEWAQNESFIVVAPKGLGNGKPAVAMWQWTKDNKGAPKTLSYGVSKQTSESGSPEKFSFKQNDYYTLDCQINVATKGLNITVKAPTNPDKVQKELALAHQTEIGAEHRFSPPRVRQEKIALDCSLPNAKPSLPRISAALPFPADLVETLSYSAAYVDQAGYLAKYAVKQFEKLDRSYHLLEKKAEARATKVAKLEGEVSRLTSENGGLSKRNEDLEKLITENRKASEKREAALEEKLRKALAALQASEGRERRLEEENKKLKKHIAKDLLEDIAREQKHKEHDAADHKAIDLANQALKEAQNVEKLLKAELDSKNRTIAELKASLDATKCQLGGAEAEILRLKAELAAEKKEKAELKEELDAALHKLHVAEQDLKHLRTEVENVRSELAGERKEKSELQRKLTKAQSDLVAANNAIASLKTKYEAKHKELKESNDSLFNALKEAKDRADLAEKNEEDMDSKLQEANKKIEEFEAKEEHVKSDVKLDIKSDVKATVAEITI